MKLHDLRPADGSRRPRTRVGRGIAAGKGKTAGRGTKGQKSRAGGSIPARFEGGQTPLHRRIPKLRGFRRPFKVEYEIVNVGAIDQLAILGAFEPGEHPSGAGKSRKPAPITVNQEILRAVGLVRTLDKPLKILGGGELTIPLFVVADAFTKTAAAKIEAAGGSASVLEVPTARVPAIGVDADADASDGDAATEATESTEATEATAASDGDAATATEPAPTTEPDAAADAAVDPKAD